MNHAKTMLLGLSALSLLSLAACRDTTQTDTSQNTTTGATPSASAMQNPTPMMQPTTQQGTMQGGGMQGSTTTTGATGMGGGASTMSDAQILQVTHFGDVAEVAQGKLAMDKAKDPRVKQLAQMMVADHGEADKKALEIVKKENMVLADSPTSTSLKSDADATTDSLKTKTGAEFDKAYVDAQVTEHQAVLDTLDTKLIPAAKDADVKAYLTEVRGKVAMHLDHARQLQTDLAKGMGAGTDMPKGTQAPAPKFTTPQKNP
jgi:putative membrane protein